VGETKTVIEISKDLLIDRVTSGSKSLSVDGARVSGAINRESASVLDACDQDLEHSKHEDA